MPIKSSCPVPPSIKNIEIYNSLVKESSVKYKDIEYVSASETHSKILNTKCQTAFQAVEGLSFES